MAQLGGTRFSLVAGGLLCMAAVGLMAAVLPRFQLTRAVASDRPSDDQLDQQGTPANSGGRSAGATPIRLLRGAWGGPPLLTGPAVAGG
ncbi:hypothetical protein [Microbispora sp. NPDC049125]|uniref:hypothetical protein n=1 Tax=Microbispora sp. NPDC049125 TaxID=3154929 RepID=UPI0034657227